MEVLETAFKFNLWHDLYTPIWGKNLRYSYYSGHFICCHFDVGTLVSELALFILPSCVEFCQMAYGAMRMQISRVRRLLSLIETAYMHAFEWSDTDERASMEFW